MKKNTSYLNFEPIHFKKIYFANSLCVIDQLELTDFCLLLIDRGRLIDIVKGRFIYVILILYIDIVGILHNPSWS